MKPEKIKPKRKASATAFRLRDKLDALARYGINGEKIAAQGKLDALIAKYDWTTDPRKQVQKDVFAGKFTPASYASQVFRFSEEDADIANAIKWAIQSRTMIQCVWRGHSELWAQADPSSTRRLTDIARTVSDAFRSLWRQFSQATGVEPQERSLFISGLADGMLQDVRKGELLPTVPRKKCKDKRAPAVSPHPYFTAATLGEQILFSVPLEEIENQLAEAIEPKQIEETTQKDER